MTLLTNVYNNHWKLDHQIAHLIVTGFTGLLKCWWDHYLNNDDRNQILIAIKRETDRSVIMTNRQPSQDAVNTLIFTITKCWCKYNNNENNTTRNWVILLNIINVKKEITQHYLD